MKNSLTWLIRGLALYIYAVVIVRNMADYAMTWDAVDFALALERFDLLAMQPHFPGYPFFVFGAMVFHAFVDNPVHAYIWLNVVVSLSAFIPVYLIARTYVNQVKASVLASVILTMPFTWLLSAQPMSEATGIAVLWWFLWSVQVALTKPHQRFNRYVPIVLFALLMGVRVSFFPFGLLLLGLWVQNWRQSSQSTTAKVRALLGALLLTGVSQLIWIYALISSEGSLTGFIKLAKAFIQGHFSEWGGGVIATSMPFTERLYTLIAEHFLWTTIAGQSVALAIIISLLTAVVAIQALWNKSPLDKWQKILVLTLLAYGIWVLLGQNIEKPRHIAPVAGPLMMLVLLAILRKPRAPFTYALLGLLFMLQLQQGNYLIKQYKSELPATYQLHAYLDELKEDFVVYTWEETRVLGYLKADYVHKRIYRYALLEDALRQEQGKQTIYVTNHVRDGFIQQQPEGLAGMDFVKVAQFKATNIVDPVYNDIILYKIIEKVSQ